MIDPEPGQLVFGITVLVSRSRTVFIADTVALETPTPTQLADIACQTAAKARRLGHEPRVALLSYANFGNPPNLNSERVHEAVVDPRRSASVDFEYDGEMAADVALDRELLEALSLLPPDRARPICWSCRPLLGARLVEAAAEAGRRHRGRAGPHRPFQASADHLDGFDFHRHGQHGGARLPRGAQAERVGSAQRSSASRTLAASSPLAKGLAISRCPGSRRP